MFCTGPSCWLGSGCVPVAGWLPARPTVLTGTDSSLRAICCSPTGCHACSIGDSDRERPGPDPEQGGGDIGSSAPRAWSRPDSRGGVKARRAAASSSSSSSFSSALRCRRTFSVPVRRHGDPPRPLPSPSQGLRTGQEQQSGATLLLDTTSKPLLSALMQHFCCHGGDFWWQGKVQRGHTALNVVPPPPSVIRYLHSKVPALSSASGTVSSRGTGDSGGTGSTGGGQRAAQQGSSCCWGPPALFPLWHLVPSALCPQSPWQWHTGHGIPAEMVHKVP